MDLSMDILKVLSYLLVMAANYAILHSVISKLPLDAKLSKEFKLSFEDAIVQGSVYVPDMMLFIGGYLAMRSILRVYDR